MYKVIEFFTDLQDFSHPYHPGDTFPRDGLNVSDKRLKELSSKDNIQKKALIKYVPDGKEPAKPDNSYTKTDIMRMSKVDLTELATKNGYTDAENASGSELKSWLVEHLV